MSGLCQNGLQVPPALLNLNELPLLEPHQCLSLSSESTKVLLGLLIEHQVAPRATWVRILECHGATKIGDLREHLLGQRPIVEPLVYLLTRCAPLRAGEFLLHASMVSKSDFGGMF